MGKASEANLRRSIPLYRHVTHVHVCTCAAVCMLQHACACAVCVGYATGFGCVCVCLSLKVLEVMASWLLAPLDDEYFFRTYVLAGNGFVCMCASVSLGSRVCACVCVWCVGCNWFICDLFVERLGSDSETVYVLVLPACCVHTYVWADLLAVCKKTLNKKMALVVPKESHQNLRKSGSLAHVLKS